MADTLIYSVDSSAFIFLNREYSHDVFPDLWDKKILGLIGEGRLIATEEVKDELQRGDDFLKEWVKSKCDDMFIKTNGDLMGRVQKLLTDYPNFVNSSKPSKDFADPFVIALALEAPTICADVCDDPECVVVSYENYTGNMHGPKIPDVCRACNIRVIRLIDIFKAEGWKFGS